MRRSISKALRGLDVFKVDPTKGLGDVDHGLDEGFRVFSVDFNVETRRCQRMSSSSTDPCPP